jgi:DNA-binding GntR family transcriptional regulator
VTLAAGRNGAAPVHRASDQAYDRLLEMLVDLRLPPGTPVNEQQLATQIGFGRMPVREALARLAGDRFVTVIPRRGAVVTSPTLEDVLDLFEAREAIECGVAHIAARRATDEDLVALRRLVAEAEQTRDSDDPVLFLRADHAVHGFLVHMVRNGLLQDAADRLLLHNLRFWRSYWSTRPAGPSSMLSHTPLLEALEARDPLAAEQAMREHLAGSRSLLEKAF